MRYGCMVIRENADVLLVKSGKKKKFWKWTGVNRVCWKTLTKLGPITIIRTWKSLS
jgi:hypothetical protein